MRTEPRLLLIAILLLAPPAPAAGEPVELGATSLPLGLAAFPDASACLNPTGCGSDDLVLRDATLPLLPPVSPAAALLGHRLDLVALDLEAADEIRLDFPRPITNQAGDDLYLGQARFLSVLADAQGLNDLELRFGDSTTWYGIGLSEFAQDARVTPTVTFSDPETKQDAYQLWIAQLDLSDFGFAPGAEIDRVFVRGSLNLSGSGLDLAVLGNLNAAPAVPALPPLGMAALAVSLVCLGAGTLRGRARRSTRCGITRRRGSSGCAVRRGP